MFFFRVYNSMVCGIQTRVLPIRYDMIIRCVLSVGDVYFCAFFSSFHFLHFIFQHTVRSTYAFVSCFGTLIRFFFLLFSFIFSEYAFVLFCFVCLLNNSFVPVFTKGNIHVSCDLTFFSVRLVVV